MFNVGGGEILVILVIALVVLGPQRLPGAARQVGKAMGELRRMSTSFQSELRGALDDDDAGTPRGPVRDVRPLGSPTTRDEDATVSDALRAVSDQASPENGSAGRTRRSPLRAAPLEGTDDGDHGTAAGRDDRGVR